VLDFLYLQESLLNLSVIENNLVQLEFVYVFVGEDVDKASPQKGVLADE
jgi:hypothetical protein